MYNKIFTKILDSSVWLEPSPTRIVWITMIAAMDENGFCQFAAIGNVAGRARVSEEEARKAIHALESPDKESSDQDNEGRRIERVPGGWIVLNAPKYRAIVTRANAQERTKERVRRFRQKKHPVTHSNVHVTVGNGSVTPSEADTETEAKKHSSPLAAQCETLWKLYPRKVGKAAAFKAMAKALRKKPFDAMLLAVGAYAKHVVRTDVDPQFIPHPATWFNQGRYDDETAPAPQLFVDQDAERQHKLEDGYRMWLSMSQKFRDKNPWLGEIPEIKESIQ